MNSAKKRKITSTKVRRKILWLMKAKKPCTEDGATIFTWNIFWYTLRSLRLTSKYSRAITNLNQYSSKGDVHV